MSEHYDFHYQPTGSGAISGQQVLQQTEDAINELGDYVNDNVGGAMDVAQQALETAQTAETNAQTALDTANSFSTAIQSAQQDASTALSAAQTAGTTAGNAYNLAVTASQDASNALTASGNAVSAVNTLSNTVTTLGQRVTTAEGNIGQNTSDITALTTRVGTAEGNITTLQNDVSIAMGNASSAMATAGTVKQQAYVLRYSSASVTDNSTIAFSTLDNTDNIKSGDKVIDVNGKIFTVVSVDTANSTVTVGSALIDLALDSNVVHTSGNETVSGIKTFSSDIIRGSANNNTTIQSRNIVGIATAPTTGNDSKSYQQITATLNYSDSTPSKTVSVSLYVNENAYSDGKYGAFYPNSNNTINLGLGDKRWANVYATNYYYGSSNVEFSTKFVTTDTTQTVSGSKTFSSNVNVYNSDSATDTANIVLKNSKAERGSTTNIGGQTISFLDKDNAQLGKIKCEVGTDGFSILTLDCTNSSNSTSGVRLRRTSTGTSLMPIHYNGCNLGTTASRWYDVQTNQINGLTPSSLSLPTDNLSNIIDISSYLSTLDGSSANTYQAPDNGYISIIMNNCSGIQAYITGFWGHQIVRPSIGEVRFFMPICKNMTVNILIFGGTIDSARFIPCQGNV